jgi:hypothetical protein
MKNRPGCTGIVTCLKSRQIDMSERRNNRLISLRKIENLKQRTVQTVKRSDSHMDIQHLLIKLAERPNPPYVVSPLSPFKGQQSKEKLEKLHFQTTQNRNLVILRDYPSRATKSISTLPGDVKEKERPFNKSKIMKVALQKSGIKDLFKDTFRDFYEFNENAISQKQFGYRQPFLLQNKDN